MYVQSPHYAVLSFLVCLVWQVGGIVRLPKYGFLA